MHKKPSPWATLVALLTAVLVVELDSSIVNVALPTLTTQFQASADEIARVVLVYLLAIVSFLLILGNVSDLLGKKRVFVAGYALFLVASVLCGLSPSLSALQGARFLQGLGGAMLTTTANALILMNMPPERRGIAFGLFGVFSGVGVALGPPVGGALVRHLGWPSIFFVNVIPCGLGILLARTHLKPDEPSAGPPERFDYLGGLASLVAITTFVLVANTSHGDVFCSPAAVLGLGVSLVAGVVFIVREARAPNPLVDLGLFRNRVLSAGLAAQFLLTMTISGLFFAFPFYLTRVLSLPPDTIGYLLGISPVASLLFSPLAGSWSDRFGPGPVSLAGRLLMLLAALAFTRFTSTTPLLVVALVLAFYGVAMTLFMTSVSTLVMGEAPAGKEGVTSSVNVLSIFLGNLLGVNLFEATLSHGAAASQTYMTMPLETLAGGFSQATCLAAALAVGALVLGLFFRRPPAPAGSPAGSHAGPSGGSSAGSPAGSPAGSHAPPLPPLPR